jgi:uncharacterized protein (TIRG00374 family)
VKRKLITLAVSLLILAAIYYRIDARRLLAVLGAADPLYLGLGLGLVVPLTLFTAWRLQIIAPANAHLSFAEANRLILVASTMNMVLPSKMGDIAKAYFMKSERTSGSLAFALVIFEKSCDMLSLLFWCALGLLFYPVKDATFWLLILAINGALVAGLALLASPFLARCAFSFAHALAPSLTNKFHRLESSWSEMQNFFWSGPRRVLGVSLLSIFLWSLHLFQIWLFVIALRAFVPFTANLGLAPLALLAGLLPLTFAGIGTRDAALIFLYHPYFDAPIAAALGILCTARYFIPAVAGLVPLPRYLSKLDALKSGQIS